MGVGWEHQVTFTHMPYFASKQTSWSPGLLISSLVMLVRVSGLLKPVIKWAGMCAWWSWGVELGFWSCLLSSRRQLDKWVDRLLTSACTPRLWMTIECLPGYTPQACMTQLVIWVSSLMQLPFKGILKEMGKCLKTNYSAWLSWLSSGDTTLVT